LIPALDPIATLVAWCDEARARGLREPEAMTLATATRGGAPSARVVLFRGLTAERAIRFFTNYESRKARELDDNPRAAAVFYWADLGKQARIEGPVSRLPAAASDEYFASRPRLSQLGAWASPQSQPIGSLDELMARRAERERELGAGPVPRPGFWGGYALLPERVELWVNGEARFHERRLFEKAGEGWRVSNLAP
jgi:pyridoxamine 5'-phosphate oxidase